MAKPEIATERTRLSIPFDDRQRAIRAAGKLADGSNALDYVKEEKVWYAQPGANLSRLKEWIFDPNKVIEEPPLDIQAIEDEFTAWLEERGAIIKDPIEFDGQKHYVDTVDGKAGSRKGVYAAFLDGRPAGWYRDYKNGGEIQKWVSTGAAPNPEQMAMLRADAAARREQRAAAQADKFDQTANRLMEEYNRLPDATGDLAYLKNKQVIAANGLKADERGNVVIPLFNADGEFRTLERIWSDGSKHLEKDGQAWGSFFVVGGQLKDGDNLLYAEGYATAASISEAINQPVIMTVNAGNMVGVAGRLKDAFPNSTHYFLADNDIYKDENVGLEKATESAANTAPAENETEEKKKKTNEELENGIRWATNDNAETPPKERIDLEGLIARFGYRAEKDYTAYTLDGQDAFYDYGSHLRMATPEASQSDEMILAAVLTADKQHHRGIEITGSDEFKERVFNLISEYNIEVKLTNPEQRVKLLELKKANETAKETAKENVADSKANKQEGVNEKANSSVQQNGMRWEESASVQPKKQNASDTQKEDKAAGESWEKGVIVAHGRAKYEWKDDESMNYFVTLKNEHGEKTLWGKDLERAVKDAGVDTERLVTVRKLGFVDVEVNAPVRDESNKIVRYETIQTKRNEWEVKPVYPQPTAGNEQAYKPSELVPYDAATFQKLRTTIQQITGVDLSREAVPEKELYWFLPNGKPAPESMTKPTGYKLPQESKTAGTPLLVAPHKKGERPDYYLVESRKGFMQGIAKDKESGEYHSVIGKVNKRIDKDGNWKTYMTLSAINKNSESGIVLHGYGHVDQGGKNLLYKNTIANEKQPQHLQPASDEVKNKTVMKQLFHPSNAAKRKDDERREQTHAPVAKSAPRP
uniref:TraC n=1 Tax=Klebsiella pneumoniae TaxID=573 RepID=A0A1W5T8F3_KLEPN|nr:LPD7 domain-containing protein [Klebsiella pneumoniae]ARF19282.1 traC [Klebsiella pneumoniae]